MLEMLMQWYRRRFSDPEAIAWLLPPLGDVDCIGGFRRYIATDGVRGIAYRLATGHLLNPRYAGDAQ